MPFFKIDPAIIRFTQYLKKYKVLIALSVLCMILAGSGSSLIALLLGKLTDMGFYEQDPRIIVAAPVGLILIAVLHGGSMYLSNYFLGKISQSILYQLRQQIFKKTLRWPAETYQQNPAGMIASKFVLEANMALSDATRSCIIVVRDSFQLLALTVTLIWQNWMLAGASFLIVPLVVWLLKYINKQMRTSMSSFQESFPNAIVRVKESFEHQKLIKISNTYDYEQGRFESVNEAIRGMMVRMTKVTALGTPLTQLICMTGVAIVLGFAMFLSEKGTLSFGEFVTFLAALLLMTPPLKNLAGVNASFVIIGVAAGSLFHTLDEPLEKDEGKGELENCVGRVSFDGVSLRYPGQTQASLENISLDVHAGESIGIVGLSGSGKSSMINLLPRIWNPTAGRILIDGVDIQTLKLSSLRKNIAVVSQDVFLFDDTIRANIAYGNNDVPDEVLMNAVRAAALEDFIASLPEGLDTMVGEAGSRLSGGQKQRISIARAILKNAPILILDEATSALDSESEASIQKALTQLMKNRTTFIIAHRLSTVAHVDRIIAMEAGHIVETGAPDELRKKGGVYAKLCELQFGEKDDCQC